MSQSHGIIEIEGNEGEMPTFTITVNNDEVAGEDSFWDFVKNNTTTDKLTEFVDRAFKAQPEIKEATDGSQIKFMNVISRQPKLLESFLWREYGRYLSDIFMDTFNAIEIKKPDEVPEGS